MLALINKSTSAFHVVKSCTVNPAYAKTGVNIDKINCAINTGFLKRTFNLILNCCSIWFIIPVYTNGHINHELVFCYKHKLSYYLHQPKCLMGLHHLSGIYKPVKDLR